MYKFADVVVEIGRGILELTTKLGLGEQTAQRLVAFCLHARMVDLSSGVAALLRAHDVAGIPHLVRGQLEAYADLRNVLSDASYVANMDAAYCDRIRRVLGAVVREDFDRKGLPDVAGNLAAAQARLAELAAGGIHVMNVADRFRNAGLLREYYSVYAYLCSHSHNNVSALEERHVNKETEPHQLRIMLDAIDQELAILIELSLRLPLTSLGLLAEIASGVDQDAYKELQQRFARACAEWASETGRPGEPAV